jgi:hypothetical protein
MSTKHSFFPKFTELKISDIEKRTSLAKQQIGIQIFFFFFKIIFLFFIFKFNNLNR